MNTLVIVLLAAIILVTAYVCYGRWLAKKWGIDPKAETPAVKYKDGKDEKSSYSITLFDENSNAIQLRADSSQEVIEKAIILQLEGGKINDTTRNSLKSSG